MMWTYTILFVSILRVYVRAGDDNDDPVLYYYALKECVFRGQANDQLSQDAISTNGLQASICEVSKAKVRLNLCLRHYCSWRSDKSESVQEESERSLPWCAARQACSALLQRYWRPPALVRLCRCARRERCDTRAPADRLVELNNRAHFQFCKPITDWPECSINATPLTVESLYERMNPDELEELHHQNIQLVPPKIIFNCRCRYPNYWRRKIRSSSGENDRTQEYQCTSLPLCKTDEFCGNVNFNLNSLYQSCLCPKHHICVHDGGVTYNIISELLYHGRGWRAYCRHVDGDYSYEEY